MNDQIKKLSDIISNTYTLYCEGAIANVNVEGALESCIEILNEIEEHGDVTEQNLKTYSTIVEDIIRVRHLNYDKVATSWEDAINVCVKAYEAASK